MPIHLIYNGNEKVLDDLIHGKKPNMPGGCTIDTIRQLRKTCTVTCYKETIKGKRDSAEFLDKLKAEQEAITLGTKLEAYLLVPKDLTVINS